RVVFALLSAVRNTAQPATPEQIALLKKEAVEVLELNAPPPPNARERLRAERRHPPAPKSTIDMGRLASLHKIIHEVLPSCLSFLATKEIASAAAVNSLFHRSSWLAYHEC